LQDNHLTANALELEVWYTFRMACPMRARLETTIFSVRSLNLLPGAQPNDGKGSAVPNRLTKGCALKSPKAWVRQKAGGFSGGGSLRVCAREGHNINFKDMCIHLTQRWRRYPVARNGPPDPSVLSTLWPVPTQPGTDVNLEIHTHTCRRRVCGHWSCGQWSCRYIQTMLNHYIQTMLNFYIQTMLNYYIQTMHTPADTGAADAGPIASEF
jgi:hypothetical protein